MFIDCSYTGQCHLSSDLISEWKASLLYLTGVYRTEMYVAKIMLIN